MIPGKSEGEIDIYLDIEESSGKKRSQPSLHKILIPTNNEYKPSFGMKKKPLIDSKRESRSPDGMDYMSDTENDLYAISKTTLNYYERSIETENTKRNLQREPEDRD